MKRKVDVENFWCWNKNCPDYGKTGKGNIVLKERYGKHNLMMLKCKTCKRTFSENRGTPFFGMKTPKDEIIRTLALIPEKGSIRGAARATGYKKDTVLRWVKVAGEHSREVNEYFLRDLRLDQVQVDEIWAYIKKREKRQEERPTGGRRCIYSNSH